MKFGVIACPYCKKVKGVNLNNKTSTCPWCGKVLKIEKLKIFYKTNSQEKLRQVIGLINAELDGKLDNFKKKFKKL